MHTITRQETTRERRTTSPGKRELTSLIERLSQGDQTAFAPLYDATRALVYGQALRMLRDPHAAEEVMSEVYMQVYQQAAHYSSDRGTPAAWLVMLTRSRAIDHLRCTSIAQQRKAHLETRAFPSSLPDPETCSATAELRQLVRLALAGLSQPQRQVIHLAYYTGLSHREVAAKLGQPLGTVKSRLRQGVMALRSQIGVPG